MSKTLPTLTLALIATMLGTTTYAATANTRAQVRAETLAAIRDGTIDQGNGFPARAITPSLYPAAAAMAGNTRAQVRAETLAAIRDGTIDQGNGFPARAITPALYPPAPTVAHKTRAQVKAELAQAIRTGDMPAEGRITMTRHEEEFPQLYG